MEVQESTGERFDYDGYLVFNGVYSTEVPSNSDLPNGLQEVEAEILETLPTFSEGSFNNPGEGYEKIPFREHLFDEQKINDKIEDLGESLISLRYQYEEYKEEIAEVGDQRQTVYIPRIKDVDIYWMYPDYMFLRGQKGQADSTKATTQTAFGNNAQIQELTFEGDFLLWILYKYYNNKQLNSQIDVKRLTDSETTGREDRFGRSNIVNDSTDVSKSVPLLTGVLQQKSLFMLEGDFSVGEHTVTAQIKQNRVHIKASKGDIRRSNPVRRMALSLEFLTQLAHLKEEWVDLAPKEKYPPLYFFEEMYEECKRQGVKVEFSPEPVLKKYASLRNESLDEYDFQG
jgi:hypothetical protein